MKYSHIYWGKRRSLIKSSLLFHEFICTYKLLNLHVPVWLIFNLQHHKTKQSLSTSNLHISTSLKLSLAKASKLSSKPVFFSETGFRGFICLHLHCSRQKLSNPLLQVKYVRLFSK